MRTTVHYCTKTLSHFFHPSGNIPEPPHFTPGQTVGLVLILLLLLLLLIAILILLILCLCRRSRRRNREHDKLETSLEHTYEAIPQTSHSEIAVAPNDAYSVLGPPRSRTSYASIRTGVCESYGNLPITLDENRGPPSLSI